MSRVGKAYAISDIITVSYFYPLGPDGLTGDVSEVSRPLKDGETMEWVLVSGVSPTTSKRPHAETRHPQHVVISPCTTFIRERSIW